MKKILLLLVIGLMLMTSIASAATVIIDTTGATAIDSFTVSDTPLLAGNFYIANPIVTSANLIDHTYQFQVSDVVDFGVGINNSPITTTMSNIVLTLYGLQNFTTELFHYNVSGNWDSVISGPTFSQIITGGLYQILVTGSPVGVAGSSYTLGLNVNAPAVPVPGAAILLASGLLGLVGLRRKQLA